MNKIVKNIIKWIIAVAATVVVAFVGSWLVGSYLENRNADNYFYTVNDDGVSCTVTGVKAGVGGGVTGLYIPDKIKGYTVTAIANEAFMDNDFISSMRMPETIVSIGERAFKGCSNIKRVYITDSVTFIGEAMLEGCINLTYMEVGAKVTVIPDNFANGCVKLATVVLPKGLTNVGKDAFLNCDSLTYLFYFSNVDDWQNVEAINKEQLNNCVYYFSEIKPPIAGKYWFRSKNNSNGIWRYN